jgi:hypothetical protein
MVPAECMQLVEMSNVYMRLVAECLVHIGYAYCCLLHFVVIHVVFGRRICPFVTLLVPCVYWSERWPLRPAVVDKSKALPALH